MLFHSCKVQMRHVLATCLATQMSTCIINKAMVCLVSAAGVIAVVSIHVPVVTPHTAGILKPPSWAWYYCSLLSLLPWSCPFESKWEPLGDHHRNRHLYCRVGFSKVRQECRHLAGYWATVEGLHTVAVKSAVNWCSSEMSPTPVHGRKGETWNEATACPERTWLYLDAPSVFHIFTDVSLLQLKWAECCFTALLQCVNVLGQKSYLGPGLRRSNGGFTRLINKPWAK